MCKVFAMTNLEKVKVNSKFLNALKIEVTKSGDKDGFGYALLGKSGFLGGERTMRPTKFKNLQGDSTKVLDKLPIVMRTANQFGILELESPQAIIAHGRFSTNTISIENTHPFTNKEVALIHNGVVRDSTDKLPKGVLKTDCDTEILLRYWEMGGIEQIEKNVGGYYAMAVLDRDGKLHIARDNRAMLYISWSETIDSYIVATTEEIIVGMAKRMKWKIEKPGEFMENTYAVFKGNELIEHRKISPVKSYTSYMTPTERKSLGISDTSYYGNNYAGYEEYDPYKDEPPGYRKALEEAQKKEETGSEYVPTQEEIMRDIPDASILTDDEREELESLLTDEEREELRQHMEESTPDVVTEMELYSKDKKYAT